MKQDNNQQDSESFAETVKTIYVGSSIKNRRIDQYLQGRFSNFSRVIIQNTIKAGKVKVNGKLIKPSFRLNPGDKVEFVLPELPSKEIMPEEMPLDIIHEDDDIIVINKQADMIVHPARGNTHGTLVNGLVFYSAKNIHGKHDATGAFIPEAKEFAKRLGIPADDVIGIDCTKANPAARRRKQVVSELVKRDQLDVLAFFGHGWPSGIQFGFSKKHIVQLADSMRARSSTLKVGLFACLAAENEDRDNGTCQYVASEGTGDIILKVVDKDGKFTTIPIQVYIPE